MSALHGLRVVDLSVGIAGPVAAMLLADFGAEVVKARPYDVHTSSGLPGSAVWDRGKQLLQPYRSRDMFERSVGNLLSAADVVVVNDMDSQVPPHLVRRALGDNAALVAINISPYRGAAPWSGGAEDHGMLAATTGVALRQSSFRGEPVELIYPHLLYMQGLWAAVCGLAALVERMGSAKGQVVNVSGLDAMMVMCPSYLTIDPEASPHPARFGAAGPNPFYAPYQTGDDSWVFLGALTRKFQELALAAMDLTTVAKDPRLDGSLDNGLLPSNRGWLYQLLQTRFRALSGDLWLTKLGDAGVPVGPILRREDWLDHPQVRASGMRIEIEDDMFGKVAMPGIFVNLDGSPGVVRSASMVSDPHGDSSSWIKKLGKDASATPRSPKGGPLAGIRALDLGTILAGPYAGHLLGMLGAEVVKIEPPDGDPLRRRTFTYNRDMRSLALNLRTQRGRQIFHRLASKADIVIDNYRPGVLNRLEASHDYLSKVNPGVISCSITGFGESGPMAGLPGFDPILQAASGMMAAQGGSSEPVFLSISVNDVTAAVLCAFGALTAYLHRGQTGTGQHVATSLLSASMFMQMGELVRYEARAEPPTGGRDYKGRMLDRYFAASDGWIRINARGTIAELEAFIGTSSHPAGDIESMDRRLASIVETLGSTEACDRLYEAGIPSVQARYVESMVREESAAGNPIVARHHANDGVQCTFPLKPVSFSRSAFTSTRPPPGLGEHSREILLEIGISDAEVQSLILAGVVTQDGPMKIEWLPAYK